MHTSLPLTKALLLPALGTTAAGKGEGVRPACTLSHAAHCAVRAVPEPLQRETRGSVLGVMAAAAAAAVALSLPGVLFSACCWSCGTGLQGDCSTGCGRVALEGRATVAQQVQAGGDPCRKCAVCLERIVATAREFWWLERHCCWWLAGVMQQEERSLKRKR